MSKDVRDFWNKECEDINMDGLGHIRRLSPAQIEIIRQRCEALRVREKYVGIFVSGHTDIKADIIEFSRRLGATEEEIELDILPPLSF